MARKKNNANNIPKENTISTLERNLSEGMLTLAHMDDKQFTATGSNPNLNFATESYMDLSLPASTHSSRPLTSSDKLQQTSVPGNQHKSTGRRSGIKQEIDTIDS
ncbi:hypothetical protein TNCV_535081 [Trichonephila clavipes]|nr:hypothetical protein TNCV_535081 [Trichonephila clavipes]